MLDAMFGLQAASGYLITDLFKLSLCILSAALVYGVVLYLLKLPEIELIVVKMKERLSGSTV